jgi:Flp pilus assembly protein TadB
MAEREQAHRQNVEDLSHRADIAHRDAVLEAQAKLQRGLFFSDGLGQVLGALIAASAVAGAVYTSVQGAHWSVSVALVSLPVAAIIRAINGRKPK